MFEWLFNNILQNNLLIAWLTAVGTLGVVIWAVFHDFIRVWWNRPILDVLIETRPPDCHKTFISKPMPKTGEVDPNDFYADCYYFRLRVKNSGRSRAENAEVFLTELTKKMANGVYEPIHSFLPMNLLWSHIGFPFFNIAPRMEKHCDFGHIVEPHKRHLFEGEENPMSDIGLKTFLSLDTIVKPNTMSHLIEPGIYRIKLLVGSSNTNPREKVLEINHMGNWHDDEKKMLSEGISIKLIN